MIDNAGAPLFQRCGMGAVVLLYTFRIMNVFLLGRLDPVVSSVFFGRLFFLPFLPRLLADFSLNRLFHLSDSTHGIDFLKSAQVIGVFRMIWVCRCLLSTMAVFCPILAIILHFTQWGQLWLAPRLHFEGMEPVTVVLGAFLSFIGHVLSLTEVVPRVSLRVAHASHYSDISRIVGFVGSFSCFIALYFTEKLEPEWQLLGLGMAFVAYSSARLVCFVFSYNHPPRRPVSGYFHQALVPNMETGGASVSLSQTLPSLNEISRFARAQTMLGPRSELLADWLHSWTTNPFQLLLSDSNLAVTWAVNSVARFFSRNLDNTIAEMFTDLHRGLGSTPNITERLRDEEEKEVLAPIVHPEATKQGLPVTFDRQGLNRFIELSPLVCILRHARAAGMLFLCAAVVPEPFALLVFGPSWLQSTALPVLRMGLVRAALLLQAIAFESYLNFASGDLGLGTALLRLLLAVSGIAGAVSFFAARSSRDEAAALAALAGEAARALSGLFLVCRRLGSAAMTRLFPSPMEVGGAVAALSLMWVSEKFVYESHARLVLLSSIIDDSVRSRLLDLLSNRALLLHLFLFVVSAVIPFVTSILENRRTIKRL